MRDASYGKSRLWLRKRRDEGLNSVVLFSLHLRLFFYLQDQVADCDGLAHSQIATMSAGGGCGLDVKLTALLMNYFFVDQ